MRLSSKPGEGTLIEATLPHAARQQRRPDDSDGRADMPVAAAA